MPCFALILSLCGAGVTLFFSVVEIGDNDEALKTRNMEPSVERTPLSNPSFVRGCHTGPVVA